VSQLVTRAFDLAAANSPDMFAGLLDGELTLDGIEVRRVKVKEIRRAVVLGHYSGVMPDACQEAFGAFLPNGGLIAAAAYGPGGNSATFNAVIPGCNSKTARELIRVWAHPNAPKNTVSHVVGRTLKMLPKEVCLVVTFADSGQNHKGTIYQALNFRYLGKSQQGTRYVDKGGVEVTARLANVYRTRQPERFGKMKLQEIRDELGWKPVVSHSKHRYAIGVGVRKKTINKLLDAQSLPYPKNNEDD
jgi:hypothetical protein